KKEKSCLLSPRENLREMKGMKGTGKANCGVKEKQKERTCSND
ncbi:hypothetical protein HMPREF1406_01462, partial [Helicobacter pylori GAM239Bi]